MSLYVLKRLLLTIPTLLVVTVIVFGLVRLAPGSPVDLLVPPGSPKQAKEDAIKRLGLDQPVSTQYFIYVGNLFRGDLSRSVINLQPVTALIAQRAGLSAVLGLSALAVSYLIAVPLGMIGAMYQNRWPDQASSTVAMLGMAIPNFFLGVLMVLLFAYYWRLFPVSGYGTWQHLVLPVLTLAAEGVAVSARMVRTAMLEVLRQDFIKVLRAKGLPGWAVIWIHAFKNSLLPTISVFGLRMGWLLSGAVVVEIVFGLPGIGRLLVDSILMRDYPVIQGLTLLLSAFVILSSVLADMLYALADPRIRSSG